ncbi:MAG: AbrB/MazE/SpoVT family DNA-binding domain-containing protein [Pseudomonadota bacterium]
MQHTLKISAIGNSFGVILPKEILAKLRVGKGDQVFVTETPNGFAVSRHDEAFAQKMALAEEIMREDRDVLAMLAK